MSILNVDLVLFRVKEAQNELINGQVGQIFNEFDELCKIVIFFLEFDFFVFTLKANL